MKAGPLDPGHLAAAEDVTVGIQIHLDQIPASLAQRSISVTSRSWASGSSTTEA
jgi:hypothetical protein